MSRFKVVQGIGLQSKKHFGIKDTKLNVYLGFGKDPKKHVESEAKILEQDPKMCRVYVWRNLATHTHFSHPGV